VLALNQLQQWGFGLVPFWVTLIGGLLALFILYWIEKRSASPIIEFKIFSIRNYTLYTLIRIVSQLAFVPILFFVPTYLQDISGYGPIGAGLIMLYLTIVVGILAPFAGKWVGKLGARMPTTIAMFAYVLSYILLMQLTAEPNLIVLALALILIGIGTGISFVSTTTGATHPIPIEKIGEAMGIFLTIGFVSCAIGVALLGTTLAINSKSWLLAALAKGNFLLTQVQTAELVRVARGIGSVSSLKDYVPAASVTELSNMAKLAFMHGFRIAMLVFLFISIVGLILTFFTEKEKLSSMKEEEVAPLL
jgi:DHA2 family multidrug resistance protein